LATRPGKVAREYLAGARKRYFSPLNFYFVVAGILVFMTSMFYKIDEKRLNRMEAQVMLIKDPVQKKHMMALAHRIQNTTKYTSKYSNIMNMISTPLVTVFFWLCFRKRYNYMEHLVANMYFVGFTMTVYALIFVPLLRAWTDNRIVYTLLGMFFLFEIIYRSISYYQFLNRKGFLGYLASLGVTFFVVALWMGGTAFGITYYIKYGF
jgi:hypothetical protein